MFGDGLIQSRPVWSYHMSRVQFSMRITVRSAPIFSSAFHIVASSPIVIPWATGICANAVNPSRSASAIGPPTYSPRIGFGRSSTT